MLGVVESVNTPKMEGGGRTLNIRLVWVTNKDPFKTQKNKKNLFPMKSKNQE